MIQKLKRLLYQRDFWKDVVIWDCET